MNEQEFLKNFGGNTGESDSGKKAAGRGVGVPDDLMDSFNSVKEMMSDFNSDSSKPLRPWETPAPARNSRQTPSPAAASVKKEPEININDGEGTDKSVEKCPFCKRKFSANVARKLLGSSSITVCEKCSEKLSKEYDACLSAEDGDEYKKACEELVEKIDTSGFARDAAIGIQNILNKELTEQKMAEKLRESEKLPEQVEDDGIEDDDIFDEENASAETVKQPKKKFRLFGKKEEIGYWEYKTIDLGKSGGIGLNARKIEKVLNKLGREGWRLRAVLSDLQEKQENQYISPDESFGKTQEYAVDQNIVILERYVKLDI